MIVSRAHHQEVVAQWREVVELQGKQLREAKADYDALLARYHELRVQGANAPEKLPASPKSPLSAIGPKTEAALREMSIGLPNTVRRSMEASALSLHASGLKDEEIAAAVRAGESPQNGNGRR